MPNSARKQRRDLSLPEIQGFHRNSSQATNYESSRPVKKSVISTMKMFRHAAHDSFLDRLESHTTGDTFAENPLPSSSQLNTEMLTTGDRRTRSQCDILENKACVGLRNNLVVHQTNVSSSKARSPEKV